MLIKPIALRRCRCRCRRRCLSSLIYRIHKDGRRTVLNLGWVKTTRSRGFLDRRHIYDHLPPNPFLILLDSKCKEQTLVVSLTLKYSPSSLRILASLASLSFPFGGKLKNPTFCHSGLTVQFLVELREKINCRFTLERVVVVHDCRTRTSVLRNVHVHLIAGKIF